MQNNKVFQLFKAWTKSYSADNKNEIKLIFDENTPVGFGSCNKDENIITVGIEPYKRNLISKYQPIKDSDFIRMGVTLFHELTHYEQKTQDNAVKEITISELSKYGNPDYYLYNHHRLLHEIDAEHTGIMTMWGRLSEIYPNKADKLMLDHLTDRVTNTVYMIDQPKEGLHHGNRLKPCLNRLMTTQSGNYRRDFCVQMTKQPTCSPQKTEYSDQNMLRYTISSRHRHPVRPWIK